MVRGPGLVVDNSVVIAWFLKDEANNYTQTVLDELERVDALCPAIWPLEFSNAMLTAYRRKRITLASLKRSIGFIPDLNIQIGEQSPERVMSEVLLLATEQQLTTYDASYLDLAMTRALPISTQDKQLRRAAKRVGVDLFQTPRA